MKDVLEAWADLPFEKKTEWANLAKNENKITKEMMALENEKEEDKDNDQEEKIQCGPFNSRHKKNFVNEEQIFQSLNFPSEVEIPNVWTKKNSRIIES